MISFTILTSTPADLRDFLIARDVLTTTPAGDLVGSRRGVEWVELPNPIVTSLGPPRVFDTRRVFMVKVTLEAETDEAGSDVQDSTPIWTRTKLGKWIFNNSTAVNQTDAAGVQYRGRKVTGAAVWLLRDDDAAQIGVWQ